MGLIASQMVRVPCLGANLKEHTDWELFVSPFQYPLALYQRSTTLGSTAAIKTSGPAFTHGVGCLLEAVHVV